MRDRRWTKKSWCRIGVACPSVDIELATGRFSPRLKSCNRLFSTSQHTKTGAVFRPVTVNQAGFAKSNELQTNQKFTGFKANPQPNGLLLQGLCRFKGAVREPNLQVCMFAAKPISDHMHCISVGESWNFLQSVSTSAALNKEDSSFKH